MKNTAISRATMGRLPAYLSYLETLPHTVGTVSATTVARALELGEVQVRKDLSDVCGAGRPRVGYDVRTLTACIEDALGVHTACEAVIVGAGRLGMALLGFDGFAHFGVTIRRAFDSDPAKMAANVLPIQALTDYCALHQVQIGILTVPADAAQQSADFLVRCGIRAIWCFSPTRLNVPDTVHVRYEDLALSLAHLSQTVKNIH